MSYDAPQLTLVPAHPAYLPGEALQGTFSLGDIPLADARAVELSVLWYTEGKGDEDMAVHFFARWDAAEPQWQSFGQPQRFSTLLPNSPLSYSGVILKIRWCARLRVFMRRSKDLLLEAPFTLGAVPAPEGVA